MSEEAYKRVRILNMLADWDKGHNLKQLLIDYNEVFK